MNANRMYDITTSNKAKSTEKLSSGYKINRAADDAAGLAISEKMRRQIRGLTQATSNAMDGISAVQVMDGAMDEIQQMMQRQNELIIKGLNGTLLDVDRQMIQAEIDQLQNEIGLISERTTFNEIPLLSVPSDGTMVDKAIEVTIPAHWQPQPPVWEPPIIIYETYQSNLGLSSLKNVLTNADFITTYQTHFVYSDGTTSSSFAFNIESILAQQDTDTGMGLYTDLSFEIFVKTYLFDSNTTTGFDEKAQYFINRVASALTAGFQTATGDSSITIKGIYDSVSEKVGFIFDPQGTGRGFNSTSCSGSPRTSNEFGHRFIHQSFSPDEASKIVFKDGTWRDIDDVFIPEHTEMQTIKVPFGNNSLWIQTGTEAGHGLYIDRYDCRPESLYEEYFYPSTITIVGRDGISQVITLTELAIEPWEKAAASLEALKGIMQKISGFRSNAGAQQNRLEHTISNLKNVVENTTAAESQIRDTDMATEMVKFSLNNILSQAGEAMLAQANQLNQGVLALLK